MAPWLFHLILSIIILILAFIIGRGLYHFLSKKEKSRKWQDRLLALLLAVVMAGFYFYITEGFTDRASLGEKIVTSSGSKTVGEEQEVLIPLGDYVVIERLYEYGYVVEDVLQGNEYRMTFLIEDEVAFLENYSDYVTGNGMFINESRFLFKQAYNEEWKQVLEAAREREEVDIPGVELQMDKVKK